MTVSFVTPITIKQPTVKFTRSASPLLLSLLPAFVAYLFLFRLLGVKEIYQEILQIGWKKSLPRPFLRGELVKFGRLCLGRNLPTQADRILEQRAKGTDVLEKEILGR
jgi:hypothetical protein